MSNIAAFFDIDGTIFRDSLLIEHFKKLIKYNIIPKITFTEDVESAFNSWDNRKGCYEEYLLKTCDLYKNALIGLSKDDIDFATKKVMELESERVYRYARERIQFHLDKGHIVIFISGSPDFLVSKMAEKYKIHDFRGSAYLDNNGIFTGDVIPMWDSVSKGLAIDELVKKYDLDLSQSYAYGDTNGDMVMLGRVGNPIAINPSKELLDNVSESKTISKKFKIVVERKDVIYVLDNTVAYIR